MNFIIKKTKGFTLIELLVVIAIIGILSSVVLASLNSARLKARDARRITDVKQLQLALDIYYDSNNGYPTSTSALSPDYMATIPVDPQTNSVYEYVADSAGTDYVIKAILETDNNVLSSDIDGTPIGSTPTCDDTSVSGVTTLFYCVQP